MVDTLRRLRWLAYNGLQRWRRFGAGYGDEKEQAAAVGKLLGLGGRLDATDAASVRGIGGIGF